MNIRTGLSILNKPWLIEPQAAATLYEYWLETRADEGAWKPEDHGLASQLLTAGPGVVAVPNSTFAEFTGFDGASVAVIPVSGPLMKSDFCGSRGTTSLAALVQLADSTASVKHIVLAIDSPGGTVDGTQLFANVVRSTKKKTTALVAGQMCSAAYWIGSQCNGGVYATSDTDVFGSIGVLLELRDASEAREKAGVKIHKYLASGSPDKNKVIDDAIAGDGKALVAKLLDPVHDLFKATVKGTRPNVSEKALTGDIYLAAEAKELGLINGVSSLADIVSESTNNKTTLKNHNMTLAEFKAQHPGVYTEAQNEILAEERDRTGAWLKFHSVDPKAVETGIASGAKISQTQMSDFTIKMATKNSLSAVKEDGKENENITAPEVKIDGADDAKAADAFAKEVAAGARQLLQLPTA